MKHFAKLGFDLILLKIQVMVGFHIDRLGIGLEVDMVFMFVVRGKVGGYVK